MLGGVKVINVQASAGIALVARIALSSAFLILMSDAADPESVTEWFLVGSWEEHLRQHDRSVAADATDIKSVRDFHMGAAALMVRHLVPIGHAVPRHAKTHLLEPTGDDEHL